MMKPFLILQLRPEDIVADDELAALLRYGGLQPSGIQRVRIEKEALPKINVDDYSGIIVGGGPYNASDTRKSFRQRRFESDLFKLLDTVVDKDIPFLGACYGLGILAYYLGGTVSKERYAEDVGAVNVTLSQEAESDPLLAGLPQTFRAFVGHKEACQQLPASVTALASSEACLTQMIRVKQNIYATQFHPELDARGLALRINAYKYAGYFPPETAETLIAQALKENIVVPAKIINRFVTRYSQPVGS
ncbi:MAG: glutamine amidotransferase [Candidatus Saccharibacteria bacterium]|nr:glutamine amidotransferase [Candidatus Saccharibacteria bacterium]